MDVAWMRMFLGYVLRIVNKIVHSSFISENEIY